MSTIQHRSFYEEFFALYRSLPILWDLKNKKRANKLKMQEAYEKMLEKYKELMPNANMKELKARIGNLRTTYAGQKRRIQDSIRSGSGTQEKLKPTLWYYDLVSCCWDGQDEITHGVSSMSNQQGFDDNAEEIKKTAEEDRVHVLKDMRALFTESFASVKEPDQIDNLVKTWGDELRQIYDEDQLTEIKRVVFQAIYDGKKGKEPDEIDNLLKTWGDELRKINDEDQLTEVKRVVSLAIYDGKKGTLNKTSRVETSNEVLF